VIAVAAIGFSDREVLYHNYATALFSAGGIPLIVAVTSNPSLLDIALSRVDGALIPGGGDVNPLLYGEDPRPQVGEIQPAVDDFQRKFIDSAVRLGLPLFGICRGHQLLNVHFGGTLFQDIPTQVSTAATALKIKHQQAPTPKHINTHRVAVVEGTNLHEIIGRSDIITNSSHHQAVRDPAPGFRVTALARDGVIEGIEKVDDPRIYGVQWHPEGPVGEGDHEFLPLFTYLVDQAKLFHRKKVEGG
jgi:putative glutamine amidotransferase